MRIRFYDIDWLTDGEDVDLPKEVTMEVEIPKDEDGRCGGHADPWCYLVAHGADILSDKLDWLVKRFYFEFLPDTD